MARTCEALDATDHLFQPEVQSLIGETRRARGEPVRDAEIAYMAAIDSARRLDARAREPRASTSLALLWAERGERQKAADLLAPIYGWFTEGFDAADPKDAKALLDEPA